MLNTHRGFSSFLPSWCPRQLSRLTAHGGSHGMVWAQLHWQPDWYFWEAVLGAQDALLEVVGIYPGWCHVWDGLNLNHQVQEVRYLHVRTQDYMERVVRVCLSPRWPVRLQELASSPSPFCFEVTTVLLQRPLCQPSASMECLSALHCKQCLKLWILKSLNICWVSALSLGTV